MIILTIRTDKPKAEIGLYENDTQLAHEAWTAHRQLSVTIHHKLEALLKTHQKTWADIEGVVCFKGPGSFTGLRIGLSVANALADSLQVPIVSQRGDDWQPKGVTRLQRGENERIALPDYGGDVFTTKPRK